MSLKEIYTVFVVSLFEVTLTNESKAKPLTHHAMKSFLQHKIWCLTLPRRTEQGRNGAVVL